MPYALRRTLVPLAVLVAFASGCTPDSQAVISPSSSAATPRPAAPAPTPAPTPRIPYQALASEPLAFLWTCGDAHYTDPELARADSAPCTEEPVPWGGTVTPDQQFVIDAGPELGPVKMLAIVYKQCAQDDYYPSIGGGPDHAFSNWEWAKALTLACTAHPQTPGLIDEVNAAENLPHIVLEREDRARRSEGKLITSDGSYLIGPEIPAGVWQVQADKVESCYWEISDATGGIIDNNFISVAPQFEVTVPSSAAGFTTEGCGGWRWLR